MASERVERRLTAILAADVAGYSRLIGLDEEGTHIRLKEHLCVFVDPTITDYRGRVVKKTGDGMLAEFGSVVDAVRCAVDIQRGMAERTRRSEKSRSSRRRTLDRIPGPRAMPIRESRTFASVPTQDPRSEVVFRQLALWFTF
jgi:class 3 adenylate cyclase